jgi:hypothetical protein
VYETLFDVTDVPALVTVNDPDPINLGVRFTAAEDGYVAGIRFYKGEQNTGTHTGTLWTAGGAQLATATFTGETAGGWQQTTFAAPVAVTAGQTYVASYHTDAGFYSATSGFFASDHVSGPLTAPAGGNGVFAYGADGLFPSGSFNATNYWVDVLYQGQLAA